MHYAGDAVLARFQSIVAATQCAIGIQNTINTLCAELAEDKRLLFRIGINLGEVIVDRNDIYGDDVNVAARLESLAEPGGICISEAVFQQVHDKIKVQFHDIGEQKLKNIEHPIQAYHILSPSHSSNDSDESSDSDKVLRVSQFSKIVRSQHETRASRGFRPRRAAFDHATSVHEPERSQRSRRVGGRLPAGHSIFVSQACRAVSD